MAIRYAGPPSRFGDQWFHLQLAREWRAGRGLSSSAEISAGYPLFVAMVDLVRSLSPVRPGLVTSVGVAQSLIAGATVVATGVLGRRVAGPAVGLAAATTLAVWPNLVIGASVVMSEPLATLLGLLVVTALVWDRRPTTARLVLAGVLLALAVEVRPSTIVLVVLFAAAPAGASWRARGRSLAVGAGAALLVIAPFALRSSYVTRSFVPLDLRQGASLCLGRLPQGDGGPIPYEACPVSDGASAVEANQERLQRAWRLLRDHPGREPRLVLNRLDATVWFPDRSSFVELDLRGGRVLAPETAHRWTSISTWWSRAVFELAVIGTAWSIVRRDRTAVLVAAAGWLLLFVPLISLGDPRFRVPSLPFFAVTAATTVVLAARRLGRRDEGNRLSPSEGSVGSLH